MKSLVLAAGLLLATAPHASPPADWIGVPGASAEYVNDPVFGGRIALYRAGPRDADEGKETVVLVHGLGSGAARDWSKLIPALAARYRVLALDLPGFGDSDKGNHYYSPDNFARVLETLLEHRAPRPFILVAHSMGGTVALAYTAAYPQRVGRLVLVDTAGVLHRSVYTEYLARAGAQRALGADPPWVEQVVRTVQNRLESVRGGVALKNAELRQLLLRGDPGAISAFVMVEHDFSTALRAITAPTLVIWGADDPVAPLRTGQALASAIAGARLVVLEGAEHTPQLEVPDRFNAIVLDELDGRRAAAAPYALQNAPVSGTRAARCDGQRFQEFSGDYESLVLDNCPGVRISNARIGHLQATRSGVRIVNSHVRDGIEAKNSRLELTGGTVGGRLVLDASNVDAAATRFESNALASNIGAAQVVLRFSVASAGPGSAPRPLHDIIRLAPGATLIR